MPARITAFRTERSVTVLVFGLLSGLLTGTGLPAADAPLSFVRDVQPILSDKCLSCHGPDDNTREADLRLDVRDSAIHDRKGQRAIEPGKPDASEVVRRMLSTDPDEQMPPPGSGKSLTAREIDILKKWIEQGAAYETHWAFVVPRRPNLPTVRPVDGHDWSPHPIDRFVLERLQQAGLKPSLQAPRHVLARRLSLDLIGLPPSPDEVAAFIKDCEARGDRQAVADYTDRLLASPRFGERMALLWMDAARYSDTDGFQADATRSNWPWRDWVIDAFNRNLPFDQFTIEQFAGDLLPNATEQQKLATCFHRNHMTNGEGGRDPEESRVDYVIDRVNTIGTVWLGLTLGCCQCHSHKYDPISQSDYYSLSAFFNSIDEDGKAGSAAKPFLSYQSPYAEAAVQAAQAELERRQADVTSHQITLEKRFPEWLKQQASIAADYRAWHSLKASQLETTDGTVLAQEADGTIQSGGPFPKHEHYRITGQTNFARLTGLKLELLPHASHTDGGLSRSDNGHVILTGLKVLIRRQGRQTVREVPIAKALADYSPAKSGDKAYGPIGDVLDDDPRTGWTTEGSDPHQPRVAQFAFEEPQTLTPDDVVIVELFQHSLVGHRNIGRFRLLLTDQPGPAVTALEPAPLEELAKLDETQRSALPEALTGKLKQQFLADQPDLRQRQHLVEIAQQRLAEVKKDAGKLSVMVLAERAEPRKTYLLKRGVWDQHGDEVSRGVPAAVTAWPEGLAKDRTGLAKWLVSPRNPLTARVTVNRFWQMFWGAGLVRTPEDFGLQGERPTHPELLDWLAVEFVESGWNVKALLKRIVTSAAYQQSSKVSAELLALDPENRLLARGARFRLPASMIRDAALTSSGLLNRTLGGPSVRPWQPEGIWEENTMGRFHYEPTLGPDQYRRTVYAFWRRSVAPTFLFDSAQRRVCEVRVARTNTPLHALTLLNDVTYLEAGRALAAHGLQDIPDSDAARASRIAEMYRRVLAREPRPEEVVRLLKQLDAALSYYRDHPEAAARFNAHGQWQPENKSGLAPLNPTELAAYSVVAGTILNLDEAVTRE